MAGRQKAWLLTTRELRLTMVFSDSSKSQGIRWRILSLLQQGLFQVFLTQKRKSCRYSPKTRYQCDDKNGYPQCVSDADFLVLDPQTNYSRSRT